MIENVIDPLAIFEAWFSEAQSVHGKTAEIAALATVDSDIKPSVRMINYKGQREGKFSFFTNYSSRKGSHLNENPCAALTFYWSTHRRQVRIAGLCEMLSDEESNRYFATRNISSQATVIISKQSQPLKEGFSDFLSRCTQVENMNSTIARSICWGGYGISPEEIEFWEGGYARCHYRRLFKKSNGIWTMEELYP